MEVGNGRKSTTKAGDASVVPGSVWESRMKLDEDRGGIKVFNGEEGSEEKVGWDNADSNGNAAGIKVYQRSRQKQGGLTGVNVKRKTWKSEGSDRSDKSPIQTVKQRSELVCRNVDEKCKVLSVSAEGIRRSPLQTKKKRSEMTASVDGIDKSPSQKLKVRSLSLKEAGDPGNGVQLRKVKSESNRVFEDGNESNSELRKLKSEGSKDFSETVGGNEKSPVRGKSLSIEDLDGSGGSSNIEGDEIEKDSAELGDDRAERGSIERSPHRRSDESCKELVVHEEKEITSELGNVGQPKSPPATVANDDSHSEEEDWDDEAIDEEMEVEDEVETKSCEDVKEISKGEERPKEALIEEKSVLPTFPIVKKQQIPAAKSQLNNVKQVPLQPIPKKQQPPFVNSPKNLSNSPKSTPTSVSDNSRRTTRTHNKLHSFVDLVMWRDVSRSAFIFGIGTFLIISSSYTKDLNISVISVVSYVGLVYLAAIFIFRSIFCRGALGVDDASQDYVVGHEEATWILNLILPYLNEFILKLKALFSGDPATTMKLAVLLFVMARCGSSITTWKMAKLGQL